MYCNNCSSLCMYVCMYVQSVQRSVQLQGPTYHWNLETYYQCGTAQSLTVYVMCSFTKSEKYLVTMIHARGTSVTWEPLTVHENTDLPSIMPAQSVAVLHWDKSAGYWISINYDVTQVRQVASSYSCCGLLVSCSLTCTNILSKPKQAANKREVASVLGNEHEQHRILQIIRTSRNGCFY